jgi:hypothetical protein
MKSKETFVAGAGLSEEQIEVMKAASWIQKDTPFYLISGESASVTLYLRGYPSIQYSL